MHARPCTLLKSDTSLADVALAVYSAPDILVNQAGEVQECQG